MACSVWGCMEPITRVIGGRPIQHRSSDGVAQPGRRPGGIAAGGVLLGISAFLHRHRQGGHDGMEAVVAMAPATRATARQDHVGNFTGKARLGPRETPTSHSCDSACAPRQLLLQRRNDLLRECADTPHGGVGRRAAPPQQIKCGFSQPGFAYATPHHQRLRHAPPLPAAVAPPCPIPWCGQSADRDQRHLPRDGRTSTPSRSSSSAPRAGPPRSAATGRCRHADGWPPRSAQPRRRRWRAFGARARLVALPGPTPTVPVNSSSSALESNTAPSAIRPSRTKTTFTTNSSSPPANSRVPSSGSTSQVGFRRCVLRRRPLLGDHRNLRVWRRADRRRCIASAAPLSVTE